MAKGIQFSITIEGDTKVLEAFDLINSQLNDPYWPLNEFRIVYMPEVQRNIDLQGAVFNKRWKKLKPRTVKKKEVESRTLGYSKKPMIRTGRMRSDFRSQIRRKGLASTDDYQTVGRLTVYNPTSYFKYHQSGEKRSSTLPRRVMLWADKRMENWLVAFHTKWIATITKSALKK